jgi:hypothetical protein
MEKSKKYSTETFLYAVKSFENGALKSGVAQFVGCDEGTAGRWLCRLVIDGKVKVSTLACSSKQVYTVI